MAAMLPPFITTHAHTRHHPPVFTVPSIPTFATYNLSVRGSFAMLSNIHSDVGIGGKRFVFTETMTGLLVMKERCF